MEIMPRTVLKIFIAFYTMAATLSLVNAAPTTIASAPAATTTAPTGMAGNPAVLTFNQSQCPTSGSDSSDSVAEANNSLCHGQFISKGVIEDILGNVTGNCSNDSLSITQVVIDMKNTFCGASESGMELHILASVLQTYHNMAVQAASTATDAKERTRMQIISEILRGLVIDYFRVVSPNHCSCTNASSCVTTVDLTEKLNLSYLTSNCSLATYLSQHIFNDRISILISLRSNVKCRFRPEAEKDWDECLQWIDEHIQPDSPANQPARNQCLLVFE